MSVPSYDIITDSTANLPDELLKQWRLRVIPLEYIVDDVSYKGYDPEQPTDNKKFYDMMREGKIIKTAMARVGDAEQQIRDCFDSGQDAIYIGFDSVLSANYEVISTYLENIRAEFYPERKLRCVDTLAATLGEGLIVALAVRHREAGMSLDELTSWVEDNRLSVACWFSVDDLKYLQRGGRLTAAAAFAGTLLNIMPILHIDSNGSLIPRVKLRGRKRVLQYLAEKINQQIVRPTEGTLVAISHADCMDDVRHLRSTIEACCPGVTMIINELDPVVGAHTGPGTICMFFVSKEGRG
jgi:DegV family protein with EDD domain